MKKLFILILVMFTVSLFGLKLYVCDGTVDHTGHYIDSQLEQISDRYYKLSGDFTEIPFKQNLTTLGIEEPTIGIAQFRCLVESKTDTEMFIYTSVNIPDQTIDFFYIQISEGHAITCRNKLIIETLGVVNPSDIYAGSIGLQYNLFGVAEVFDFDIISVSKTGLRDDYNTKYGELFDNIDKLIVHAHYDNYHREMFWTSYIGEIVTCSFGADTGTNRGSYGFGLEFFHNLSNKQSWAVPQIAGMFAKLKILTGKSYDEIRTALRETASFAGEWKKDGGYGAVDYQKAYNLLMDISQPKPPRAMPVFNPFNPLKMPIGE